MIITKNIENDKLLFSCYSNNGDFMAVGIVAEFNPFHNGHLYLIKKAKKLYSNEPLIIILGGNFLERGEASILNKWQKTEIALDYNADIIVELPFPFATQSADYFAYGAVFLLKALQVDKIIFGSESNDLEMFSSFADIQLQHPEYQQLVKKEMNSGKNYPTALSNALKEMTGKEIRLPNDTLALSYIREIKKQHANITPISIQRTNDYHNLSNNHITSAESIRKLLLENQDITKYIPNKVNIKTPILTNEQYFPYLKYQIMTHYDHLEIFQTVDEGMSTRIKKAIVKANNYQELIQRLKTKRYTYNRIQRMLTHILCNFTKEEAKEMRQPEYIRILGFSDLGKKYLNQIKKELTIPLITTYSKGNSKMLKLEQRITSCYALPLSLEEQKKLWEDEYKKGPIQK